MKDKRLLSVCLVEGAEELILASAPCGVISVGDLVKLEGSANEIFRVQDMLSYPVEEDSSDCRFLRNTHGEKIYQIRRIYRPAWEEKSDVQ